MKELSNLVVEKLLPGESGPGNTILEVLRSLLDDQFHDSLKGFDGLSAGQGQGLLLEGGILDVLAGCEGGLSELALEQVPGPLEGVLDCIGEILQSTNGNGFLGGILGRGITLCHLKHKNKYFYHLGFTKLLENSSKESRLNLLGKL